MTQTFVIFILDIYTYNNTERHIVFKKSITQPSAGSVYLLKVRYLYEQECWFGITKIIVYAYTRFLTYSVRLLGV
jgi:hypothetical protein